MIGDKPLRGCALRTKSAQSHKHVIILKLILSLKFHTTLRLFFARADKVFIAPTASPNNLSLKILGVLSLFLSGIAVRPSVNVNAYFVKNCS